METPRPKHPLSIKKVRRQAITVADSELVEMQPLTDGETLPLLVRPKTPGVDLLSWGKANKELLGEKLLHHGGILFRDFNVQEIPVFEDFVRAVSGDLVEYKERSSPRSQVEGKVYTSTDHPPSQPIFLHNENSYQKTWPCKIFFYCVTPAAEQGATPIADVRRVVKHLSQETQERFAERKWMYVRNFGDGFGLPWQTVFGTEDPARVEAYCKESGIRVEWKGDGRLRTRAVRPAFETHPKTGERLWFNHATFFHISTLEESIREMLLDEFDEEDLPTNTCYGDGSSIEPAVLDELHEAYRRETISFPWQKNDILMLDNMMVAHGREPFKGERKVVVGMSEPVSREIV